MAVTAVVQSLLLFIFLAVGCFPGISAKKGRIVGGHATEISKVPYIVSLRLNDSLICGGTLITKRFVVSAAHCTHGHYPEEFKVVAGSTYFKTGGLHRKVDLIVTPPLYIPELQHMDICVLRLEFPLTGPNIKPIALCNHTVPVGAMVTVSGWGRTSEDGDYVDQLHTVEVPTIPTRTCRQAYVDYAMITYSMMCAAEPGTKDACTGDSGGPMVHGNELCGVVSFGFGCGRSGFPGVYTDVYLLLEFIKKAIAENS